MSTRIFDFNTLPSNYMSIGNEHAIQCLHLTTGWQYLQMGWRGKTSVPPRPSPNDIRSGRAVIDQCDVRLYYSSLCRVHIKVKHHS